MSDLLKPVKELDSEFEYEVEMNGESYIAGVKNCHFSLPYIISGDLFLNRVDEGRKKSKREPVLSLPRIEINNNFRRDMGWSFEKFIRGISLKIFEEYKSKVDRKDLQHFFRDVYLHYGNYFS